MTLPIKQPTGEVIEAVLIKGDLRDLSPQERSAYYMRCCQSMGLNPHTQPFQYITLSGRLTLYATRACTDQLRQIHSVSVEELREEMRDQGVYVVTCKVKDAKGRTDMAKGAVTVAGLKGDVLANALMKAETKAKRRATLSLCGLGWLDESEVEDIPPQARRNEPGLNAALHEPDPLPDTTATSPAVDQAPAPAPTPQGQTAGAGDRLLAMAKEAVMQHGIEGAINFAKARSPTEREYLRTHWAELKDLATELQ